jgi:hypothetical protein
MATGAGQLWDYAKTQAAGVPGAISDAWNNASALNAAGNARMAQGNNLTGIPMALGGMAGQISAPIAGLVQQFVEQPTAQLTGDPEIAARAGLVGNMAAGQLLGGAGNAIARGLGDATIGRVDPATAQVAQLARANGVMVTAPQISASPAMRLSSAIIDRLPWSGAGPAKAGQQAALNRFVSNTIGEDATQLTPDVMNAAKNRIGNVFDNVAANTNLNVDNQFSNEVLSTLSQAQHELSEAEYKPLSAAFDTITSKIQNGQIDGATYQSLTRANSSPIGRALNSSNPNVRFFAGQLKDSLDDALVRSAPPDVASALNDARTQWRNLRTIEDVIDASGNISPGKLANAINNSKYSSNALVYGQGGQLGDAARIGQRFMVGPGSSNTAENNFTLGALKSLAGNMAAPVIGGAAYEAGVSPLLAAVTAGGTIGAGRVIGSGLRSNWLANALINRSLAPPTAPGISSLVPLAAIGGVADRQNALSP